MEIEILAKEMMIAMMTIAVKATLNKGIIILQMGSMMMVEIGMTVKKLLDGAKWVLNQLERMKVMNH